MTWKRTSITIFLLIVFLNILQINIFLLFVFNSQSADEPGGSLSSDAISSIWYGEAILGLILFIVVGIYLALSKKKEKAPRHAPSKKKSKETVSLVATTGFNHISPYYNVEIENKSTMPIIDVVLSPSLSEDSFEFDKNQKKIPLIRSNGKKDVKFALKPKQDQSGKAMIKGYVKFLSLESDEYEEIFFEPNLIAIKWPVFTKSMIETKDWENECNTLISAEEEIPNIPLAGLKCTKFLTRIAKENNMQIISSETRDIPYTNTTKIHAQDELGLNYCAKLIITAISKSESPSRLNLQVFGANKESLSGFYYFIYNHIDNIIRAKEKKEAEAERERLSKTELPPEYSKVVLESLGIQRDIFEEFDTLRSRVETIEKDKIGIDSKYTSLYELDELYKILAEDLVKRRIVDVKAGEEIVKKKMEKKYLNELKRFDEAYALLCEAETSDSVLMRKDFPDSGKKAILLVYFNAVEVYIRERLKELIPKGVTVLLGESHGHINTRKKDWEKSWSVLGLGSCIHIINRNKYIFLKDEALWKDKVETLMHQVREMRNTVAHPSKENPSPDLVREKVYLLLTLLPDVLQTKD
jgi:hypothetical protein